MTSVQRQPSLHCHEPFDVMQSHRYLDNNQAQRKLMLDHVLMRSQCKNDIVSVNPLSISNLDYGLAGEYLSNAVVSASVCS